MASIEDKIREAAPRNNELLKTLSETDYAKPALQQQNLYITDLEKELKDLDRRIATLETKRKAELKDHEKYRDSVMKRFAYKVSRKEDKFTVKAEKEEREYFEALQEEHKAKELRTNTSTTLSQARSHKKDLEAAASRHTEAQISLDDLYNSIFEGPTPAYPQEDTRENEANEALFQYQRLRTTAESQFQVLNILGSARSKMSLARNFMNEAHSASRMDMFGGGMMADMMERSALSRAEVSLSETRMLIEQARRLSPELRQLPQVNIAQGNLMSDVMFDNVFTDMQFHEKIKASQTQLERAAHDLDGQVKGAEQRYNETTGLVKQRIEELTRARTQLQQVRQEVFEGQGG